MKTIPFLFVVLAGRLALGVEAPPWGKGETLGERMALEKTAVCTDGKSHYVVLAPSERSSCRLKNSWLMFALQALCAEPSVKMLKDW